MDSIKLTVIVPVYNAGEYLEKCINSVLSQSYRNIELILVDDGSNDGSREACLAYEREHKNVHTLLQDRKGVSAARNTGLHAATGDYLLFLDNDDFYDSTEAFSGLVRNLAETRPDILMFRSATFWGDTVRPEHRLDSIDRKLINASPKAKVLMYCIETTALTRAVWTKAIRRELMIENGILFPEGRRNEDTYVTGELIRFARTFDWCDSLTYMYRKGTGKSQSDQKVTYPIVEDLKVICAEFIDAVRSSNDPEDLKTAYYSYIAYPYAVLMMFTGEVEDPRIKQDIPEIKRYAFVLKYNADPDVKKISSFHSVLGFRATVKALQAYQWLAARRRRSQ